MGPPADMEYAVEPDGVAMMSPSDCAHERRAVHSVSHMLGCRHHHANDIEPTHPILLLGCCPHGSLWQA